MIIYLELFWTFFKIGLFTFGGGYAMLPLIQQAVMDNNWIAEQAKKAPGDWSADAREWGEKNGLITGDTAGNKMYKKMLTREEFIAVLYRALHRNIIE